MAAQVLSGKGALTYTNNTGQNVRIVINYLKSPSYDATLTIAEDSGNLGSTDNVQITLKADGVIGKNLAYAHYMTGSVASATCQNAGTLNQQYSNSNSIAGVPVELALSPGLTFAVSQGVQYSNMLYNIIVIPEAG